MADEDSGQTTTNGDLHVNFKLTAAGERIGLYAPDGTVVDAVVFTQQTNNLSQGRWPDGHAAPFHFMPTPTPRASNVIPIPAPDILVISVTAEPRVTLTWRAQPNRAYRVQYKDELDEPAWHDLPGGDVTALANTATITDTTGGAHRFYQIKALP